MHKVILEHFTYNEVFSNIWSYILLYVVNLLVFIIDIYKLSSFNIPYIWHQKIL